MTLSSLKFRLKVGVLLIFCLVYGVTFYTFGRNSQKSNTEDSVKGVSTKNQNSQLNKPQPYADEQQAEVVASSVNKCSNSTYGFEISYPKDWFTTYNDDSQKCRFFAPYSFVVPQLPDQNFVPITISTVKPLDWDSTTLLYQNPSDLQNITSVKNSQINGAPVTIVESFSTGKSNITKGFVSISYLIFNSKWPLVINYIQQNQSDNIEKYKSVLKDIANSLKYF